MKNFLCEYYPPAWFKCYYIPNDTNQITDDALQLLSIYTTGLIKHNKKQSDILGWNNSWWQMVRAEDMMSAIDIFKQSLRQENKKFVVCLICC